jgi:hypothetical protein
MNEFIEKNRGLLRFYGIAARVIGWVLIIGGVIWFLLFALCILAVSDAAGSLGWPYTNENLLYASSAFVFDFIFLGLLILIIGQLIRYTLETEYKPGWLLRFGDKILYVYALVVVGRAILRYCILHADLMEKFGSGRLLFIQPIVVPLAAKALIIVALGILLRRLMPVIEESKTLV